MFNENAMRNEKEHFYTTKFHYFLNMAIFVQIFDNVANSHKF